MYADLVRNQRRIEAYIAELAIWLKDGITDDEDDLRTIVRALSEQQQALAAVKAQIAYLRSDEGQAELHKRVYGACLRYTSTGEFEL